MGFEQQTGQQQSELQTQMFPGLFSQATPLSQLASRLGVDLTGFPGAGPFPQQEVIGLGLADVLGRGISSPFQQPLQSALLQPQFGPTTASETELINSLMELTQGASAVRGLGPATTGGIAQNIAPALIGMRQQNIQNLMGASGQDIGQQLGLRGQNIGGLLELAGLSMPQIVAGQRGRGESKGFGIQGPSAGQMTAAGI